MKNLYKKIGIGAVASSLIIVGSLSNGLIAHANSIESKSYQQLNNKAKIDLDKQGDAQIVKGAKNIYGYGVFGYYQDASSKRKIENDVKELLEWYPESESSLSKISYRFNYAKDFLKHLKEKGMNECIQRVVIGDAEAILLFKEEVKPGIDWNERSSEWIYNDGQNIDGIDDIVN